jgi:OmcA/MtrC family decaheme c-type cytochrome
LNNCETCHVAGTYSSVPMNALPSTYEIVDAAYNAAIASGTATTALAKGALGTTSANLTDRVTTPFAGACVSCHDSAATKSHMRLQGAQLQANRSPAFAGGESCLTCHGPGKAEDPAIAHKR